MKDTRQLKLVINTGGKEKIKPQDINNQQSFLVEDSKLSNFYTFNSIRAT